MRLRAATSEDSALLADATLGNVNWNGPRFTLADVWTNPEFRHYVDPWPGPDDFGFVADDETGSPLGVVWLKHFPATDPGYGFVDPTVPEVSVHVDAAHRGHGLGKRLLTVAITEAKARGLRGISLSVEERNPALRLYRRLGFRPTGHHPGTYVLWLDRGGSAGPASSTVD